MAKEDLQQHMKTLHLNACGTKDVLKKRLKNFYKRQRLGSSLKAEDVMRYRYLVVIDYEATCSRTNENFIHEIIEFPAVLIDTESMAVCNVFQRFCKPRINPRLTEFCTQLTGISQQQVDKAKDFNEVFKEFEEWMSVHKLGTEHKFAVLTDGPWDMARFLKGQTEISGLEFPKWARQWINLRKAYSAFYGVGRVTLQNMLDDLGMTFQGRPHCGLDDAKNIANITVRLLKDGCVLRMNEYFHDTTQFKTRTGRKSGGGASKDGCHTEPPRVPQEGEDIADLLDLIRIQNS